MQSTKSLLCRCVVVGCVGAMLTAAYGQAAAAPVDTAGAAKIEIPWDWSGVIATGQSLAVGQNGKPSGLPTQPYNNLMLSTGRLAWPVDPNDASLAMVPLIEPIGRNAVGYPSSWPTNISGETPHAAMANQLTAMVKAATGRDFIGVHGEVGENGQCMIYLKKDAVQKGVSGRSFEGAMVETKAITHLAKAAGKTYGVGAIIITHGECDAGNAKYESDLHQLWQDYNTDLAAITGQKQKVQMIVSQQNAVNNRSAATVAQWKVGVDYPADIVCSGPKYQYNYSPDGVHLITVGYEQLGEKYAQVYFERVILHKDWQPLQPTKVERKATTITVQFHVPVGPLVWDTTFEPPHQTVAEWKEGKGFEVSTAAGQKVAIDSVAIAGDAVVITCGADPGANARVSYAMIGETKKMATPFAGTLRWGLLHDSDPFKGSVTGKAQPNWAVAFEMTAQ